MAVLIPRIRTINVRLSEAEYLALEQFCVASGARSLSDLVRETIHRLLLGASQENALISTLNEYSGQVKELQQKVERLSTEIVLLKGGVPPSIVGTSNTPREREESEPQDQLTTDGQARQVLNRSSESTGESH